MKPRFFFPKCNFFWVKMVNLSGSTYFFVKFLYLNIVNLENFMINLKKSGLNLNINQSNYIYIYI